MTLVTVYHLTQYFFTCKRVMMSFHRDKNRSYPLFFNQSIENLRHLFKLLCSLKPWTNGNGKKTVFFFKVKTIYTGSILFLLKSKDNVRGHDCFRSFYS